MTCKEVRELLSEYVDAELEGSVLTGMEDHFECCVECSDYLKTFRKTLIILKRLRDKEPPQDYTDLEF